MHAISLARLDVYMRRDADFQTEVCFFRKTEAGHFRGTDAGREGGTPAARTGREPAASLLVGSLGIGPFGPIPRGQAQSVLACLGRGRNPDDDPALGKY